MTIKASSPLIPHTHFKNVLKQLYSAISESPAPLCIRLMGMTGVGKSEVAIACARKLVGSLKNWKPNSVPAVFLRASSSQGGRFSPKSFAQRAYMAIHNPNLSWAEGWEGVGLADQMQEKLDLESKTEFWNRVYVSSREEILREAFGQSAAARSCGYWFIDDVNAMCATARSVAPHNLLRPWVQLAEESKVIAVFMGTPSMAPIWEGDGEMGRRCSPVYFPRYTMDREEDREAFAKLVKDLSKNFCWQKNFDVIKSLELIYLASVGVLDYINELLVAASGRAASRGSKEISQRDLEEAAPSARELRSRVALAVEFDELARPASTTAAKKIYAERELIPS